MVLFVTMIVAVLKHENKHFLKWKSNFENCMRMDKWFNSVSASHAMGGDIGSLPSQVNTKDHHKNGTNCPGVKSLAV